MGSLMGAEFRVKAIKSLKVKKRKIRFVTSDGTK